MSDTIRYPDQALQKLEGLSLQTDYHFLLLLKSVKTFRVINSKKRVPVPFNSIPKQSVKDIATLLGYKRSTFYARLNALVLKGWVLKDKNHYRLLSLSKINKSLQFKTYTHNKEKHEYYSFRKLQNIQGIDLQAHRIYEIIKLSRLQFTHELSNPKNANTRITSTVNNHIVRSIRYNKKVNCWSMFGMSIEKISSYGYDSKKYVWNKLKEMKKQGLIVRTTSTGKIIKGVKQYNCNMYDTSFDGIFTLSSVAQVQTKLKKVVKTRSLNAIEQRFDNMLNNSMNRIVLINAGILSHNYLKTTLKGVLVKIPKSVWSGIIQRMLNNEDAKKDLLSLIGGFDKLFVKYPDKATSTFKGITKDNSNKYYLVTGNGNYVSKPIWKTEDYVGTGFRSNVFDYSTSSII